MDAQVAENARDNANKRFGAGHFVSGQPVKKPLQTLVATRLIALRAVRSLLAKRYGVKRWALPKHTKGFHPLET